MNNAEEKMSNSQMKNREEMMGAGDSRSVGQAPLYGHSHRYDSGIFATSPDLSETWSLSGASSSGGSSRSSPSPRRVEQARNVEGVDLPSSSSGDPSKLSTGCGGDNVISGRESTSAEFLKIAFENFKQLHQKKLKILGQLGPQDSNIAEKEGSNDEESLYSLISLYQTFQTEASEKLRSLRQDTVYIEKRVEIMKKRLKIFHGLVTPNKNTVTEGKGPEKNQPLPERTTLRVIGQFARELKKLSSEFPYSEKLDKFENSLSLMERIGPEIKDKVQKLEWELSLLEGIVHHLKEELRSRDERNSGLRKKLEQKFQPESHPNENDEKGIRKKTFEAGEETAQEALRKMRQAYRDCEEALREKNQEIKEKNLENKKLKTTVRRFKKKLEDLKTEQK